LQGATTPTATTEILRLLRFRSAEENRSGKHGLFRREFSGAILRRAFPLSLARTRMGIFRSTDGAMNAWRDD
jgi:hypothetical protein